MEKNQRSVDKTAETQARLPFKLQSLYVTILQSIFIEKENNLAWNRNYY